MRLLVFLLFLVLASIAMCQYNNDEGDDKDDDLILNDPETVKKANEHIDKVLENAKQGAGFLKDPMKLPDFGINFVHNIFGFPVSGKAQITNGSITGLGTLKREGDCDTMTLKGDLIITCRLNFDTLKGAYTGVLKFMNIGPEVTISNSINSTQLEVNYAVLKKLDNTAALISNKIKNIGNTKIEISGFGLPGWATGIFMSLVQNAFSKVLKFVLEDPIKQMMQHQLLEVPFN